MTNEERIRDLQSECEKSTHLTVNDRIENLTQITILQQEMIKEQSKIVEELNSKIENHYHSSATGKVI